MKEKQLLNELLKAKLDETYRVEFFFIRNTIRSQPT